MKAKIPVYVLPALILATIYLAEAQQQAKVAKIGWLTSSATGSRALWQALRELGYVEDKNITIEYGQADNKLDRLPALVDEMVRLKVDVLVAASTPAALAAKKATRTIPIVFYNVSDPVAAELVDSLARPGGNITGFTSIAAVLAGKRLELLKETVPKLSHVAVLWNPQDLGSTQQWKESQLAGRDLGLQLYSMEASSADEHDSAFNEAVKARNGALAVTLNPVAASNRKRIAGLAAKHRLPAVYARGDFVTSGGLMSYGLDQAEPYRRVASMVDKIRKETKPADIPVEQPTKFELAINLKTAKALGLTIPSVVMMRANQVIK